MFGQTSEPGPAQGFFLLKESYSYTTVARSGVRQIHYI